MSTTTFSNISVNVLENNDTTTFPRVILIGLKEIILLLLILYKNKKRGLNVSLLFIKTIYMLYKIWYNIIIR